MSGLLLIELLEMYDHIVSRHVLVLLLKLGIYGGQHETSDVQGIILILPISISLSSGWHCKSIGTNELDISISTHLGMHTLLDSTHQVAQNIGESEIAQHICRPFSGVMSEPLFTRL
ncbi:hypothetical protein CRG98_030027 [Punica granatum]|uniref:Uncharacterized protein n=1 Tax=Punica granatum TaxID=22663 RepID=A0A2I0IZZ4_PUNGR|nr:hypothetical protein CRG98_030027 [Punica granatum]